MPSEQPAPPAEFRRYRRFLSWFVLTFVTVGSFYLLVSVAVTIYRRRNAVPTGAPVGAMASASDLRSCAEELTDVKRALERHLGDFHNLLAHYDAAEAQSWYENEVFWLGQWKAAGERCRYTVPRKGQFAKEWEELRVIHQDLRDIEQTYTKGLLRFAQQQGPRLDSMRGRLASVGRRIDDIVAAPPGVNQP
jgi:hypothetical protein